MHAFSISLAFVVAMETNLDGQLSPYPPREVVPAHLVFAEEYSLHLSIEKRRAIKGSHLHRWIRHLEDYTEDSHYVWHCLDFAQRTTVPLVYRIEFLSNLKGYLHRNQQNMPPIVPYWLFREGAPSPAPRNYSPQPSPTGA
jgi:hypothetical protein